MPFSDTKKIAPAAIFLLFITAGGCATTKAGNGGGGGFSVVKDGAVVFRGPAAFTVRDGSVPESVVTIDKVGEVIVKGDNCKFVVADTEVKAIVILAGASSCGQLRDDRLCFDKARFVAKDGGALVVVDGCADRNELFLDRAVGSKAPATFAPHTLIERCVTVDRDAPGFIRVDDIRVDGVNDPRHGLRFRWNGDGFDVCFLSQKTGHYRVDVTVDGSALALSGEVDQL